MTEAAKLAAAGAPHGTVVLADEQSAGIGRLGRTWLSPPNAGIYCSILLRLKLAPANSPIASFSWALRRPTLFTRQPTSCDLRWPNDVLIGERKVAGILTHFIDDCVVVGIGVNVNQFGFPRDLRTPATSLRMESNGRKQSREPLIVELLDPWRRFAKSSGMNGSTGIRAFLRRVELRRHRRVIVEESGECGTTSGLDENVFL